MSEVAETPMDEAEQSESGDRSVKPFELFFDLVFVFAFTQVTQLLASDPTWEGLGRGVLLIAALWIAWQSTHGLARRSISTRALYGWRC